MCGHCLVLALPRERANSRCRVGTGAWGFERRLHYVEVSQKEPFLLSSYALDEDGDGWTLEHQVPLSRIWADAGKQEGTPRIGVIDPLNARSMCVLMGNHSLAIDMDTRKVLGCSMITGGGPEAFLTALLKPCVLPPWLESSRIPSSGDFFHMDPCLYFFPIMLVLGFVHSSIVLFKGHP